MTTTLTPAPTQTPGARSQQLFEAMFDHTPQIDVRTPADVADQAILEGWR